MYEPNLKFVHLCSARYLEHRPKDRDEAIRIFRSELTLLGGDVEKIAALLSAAKAYINRHANPRLDNLLGINNTRSWSHCMSEARQQVLKQLETQVWNRDANVTDASLAQLRTHSLFGTHRNNFVLTGAYGNTASQLELDDLRWDIYYR